MNHRDTEDTEDTELDMQSARIILKKYVSEEIDEWEVIKWGSEFDYSLFEEAIELPYIERRAKIESLLVRIAGPKEPTAGERYRAIGFIEKVLCKDIKPIELSDWVKELDGRLSTTEIYPAWLSELWNTLDWCDDSWTLSTQPHFKDSLEEILALLNKLDHEA